MTFFQFSIDNRTRFEPRQDRCPSSPRKEEAALPRATSPYQGEGKRDLKALLVFQFFSFEKSFEELDSFNVLTCFVKSTRKARLQFHRKVVILRSSKQVLV